MLGGRYPPLSTRRYLPSGESAVAMGSVSSGTCLPAGATRHPLLRRNPPPGSGPTCSRGEGCEPASTARRIRMAESTMAFTELRNCRMRTSIVRRGLPGLETLGGLRAQPGAILLHRPRIVAPVEFQLI